MEGKCDEIKQRNYNLDIKNPHATEAEHSYTSGELIELLDSSFARSHDLLQQLKVEL
jgi:type I restriction enzyme M protein